MPTSRDAHAERGLPAWAYKALLLFAALLWGGSFVILKDIYDVVAPSWLLGIRFVAAGLVMTLVFWRRLARYLNREHVIAGILLGVSGGVAYLVQNLGLAETTPGHNAFLTATYCVMVPYMHWVVARVRPTLANTVAAVLAVAGIGMLSLGGEEAFSLCWGDWMTLAGAFWFAVQIEIMVSVAPNRDVLTMTVVEFYAMGLVNIAYGAVAEPAPSPQVFLDVGLLVQVAYVVLLSSCVCTVLQNVGQAHVPPSQASLLLSLESVFGVLFSVLFYGEQVTLALVLGFALVFGGVLISELAPGSQAKAEE